MILAICLLLRLYWLDCQNKMLECLEYFVFKASRDDLLHIPTQCNFQGYSSGVSLVEVRFQEGLHVLEGIPTTLVDGHWISHEQIMTDPVNGEFRGL